MAYLQFSDGDGMILVEVTPQEVHDRPGVVKAGIGEKLSDGLLKAQATLESSVAAVIDRSVGAFARAIAQIDLRPDVVEIEFSIKATGEFGNFAIGKLSGDANFAVKLTWTTSPE